MSLFVCILIFSYAAQVIALNERLDTLFKSRRFKSKRQVILYLIPFGFIPLTIHRTYVELRSYFKTLKQNIDQLP
jgi:hypothetical protein